MDNFSGGVISGLTLQNGQADSGGGIYCHNSSPVIRECTFADNGAKIYGGGIFVFSSSPSISNCTFTGNSASRGGAVGERVGLANIQSCLFQANNAGLYGGALYNTSGSTAILKNCIFHGNSARRGGAVNVNMDSTCVTAVNCTFGTNPAQSGNREVIWISAPRAMMEFRSCILYDVAAPTPTVITTEGEVDIRHSLIKGGQAGIDASQKAAGVNWGPGNLSINPLFVSPSSGDYHLKSQRGRWDPVGRRWVMDSVTSPCIDAGDPEMSVGDEPEPNGGRINMGAYGGTAEASKSLGG